jgi:AcrR family transcriptional regulator
MASTHEGHPAAARLRPGPSRLPRGQVTEIQRGRMLAAAVDTVEEVGYSGMTVAQVIGRARVSRKTFYDVFADREACFLEAFDRAVDQGRGAALQEYRRHDDWREGVRGALAGVLALMDEQPALARLAVVEALAAGERVLEHRSAVLEELAAAIDRGRSAPGALDPPALTAEGVVGAVFQVLHSRILEQQPEPLLSLLGPLMSMIVLPYLGSRCASRELSRPAPRPAVQPRRGARRRHADPLEGLKMRLTYRTVRVLMVIAQHPGASNREIAEGSGIVDQGQISKLLGRLARLELIENRGEGQEKGAANAWHLTPRGSAVERATRPR